MSYYEQVANMLGLELGEKFKITNDEFDYHGDTFYFSEDGCKDLGSVCNCNGILLSILSGNSKIVKLPWKPKYKELYWFYEMTSYSCEQKAWLESSFDLAIWKVGNCFRTKKEAEAKGKEIIEQLQKEYEEA